MCQTSTLFTRNSAKNHLATHGTTIQDYEKRYGAPFERILPQSQQSQAAPFPGSNVGHTVAVSSVTHLPAVCTPSEQPPSYPGHATSQPHSVYTPDSQIIGELEQPVPETIGAAVQPVPQVSGDQIHRVLQQNVEPELSIFDPQHSSISIPSSGSGSQIYPGNLRSGILGPVSVNDILRFLILDIQYAKRSQPVPAATYTYQPVINSSHSPPMELSEAEDNFPSSSELIF